MSDCYTVLLVDIIRHLFTEIRYSDKGTSERVREEAAFMYFIDYLDDCERSMLLSYLVIKLNF